MIRVQVEGGVRCAVTDVNSRCAKTILFVHGWPLSHEIFECQFDVLPEYGIRCVGMDLRGFGDSDKPWKGYSYERMAEDICRVITELDLRNITLLGFSMGGGACVRYMARYKGHRVSRLVLAGAACPSFVQRPGFPYGMTKEQVDALIVQAYNNRPQCVTEFARRCFANDPGSDYLQWMGDICKKAGGHATIKAAEALRDEDLRADLARVKVPTAILHGRLDQICPFEFAEEMHKGIPDSFVVPFENSGHCLFYEERNLFNATLLDFVNTKR